MTWVPVESKMLLSIAYDASKHILYLRFRSGDVYRYFDFPDGDYRQFLLAESKGQFLLSHIRNCFRYERMAKLQVA
jgi:KTSC domain-containing protein